MKKLFLYTLIILFLLSIYKDLTTGVIINSKKELLETDAIHESTEDYEIVKVKVNSGDTVLSIVEELNTGHVRIEKVLIDFSKLNPNVDPYQLKTNTYYHFPIYNNN